MPPIFGGASSGSVKLIDPKTAGSVDDGPWIPTDRESRGGCKGHRTPPDCINTRPPVLGVACGITTLLLVGALTISVLGSQYGESPGVGILGLFSGVVAGLIAAVVVGVTADRFEGWAASALVAYGTFGAAFLGIAGVQYVNVPGADDLFAFRIHLLTSLLLAVVVAGVDHRGRA